MIADRTLSHHTPRPRTRLRLPPLHTPYIILASSGELSPLDEAMVMIGTVCKDQAQQTFVDAGYTDVKLETVGSSALNSEGNVETTYQMVPLTCDNFGGELKQLFINAISMCVEVKADQVQVRLFISFVCFPFFWLLIHDLLLVWSSAARRLQ